MSPVVQQQHLVVCHALLWRADAACYGSGLDSIQWWLSMACSGCGLHAACRVQRLCLAITLHAALAHVVQQQQCAVGTLQGALAAGELTMCFMMISVVCSYVYAVIECAFVVLTALRIDVRKTVRIPLAYRIRCRIAFVNTFANTFVNSGMRSCLRRFCEFARWCSDAVASAASNHFFWAPWCCRPPATLYGTDSYSGVFSWQFQTCVACSWHPTCSNSPLEHRAFDDISKCTVQGSTTRGYNLSLWTQAPLLLHATAAAMP